MFPKYLPIEIISLSSLPTPYMGRLYRSQWGFNRHQNPLKATCLRLLPWRTYHCSRQLSSSPTELSPKVVFSGIQPTGIPHLGNYLGALRQWLRLQSQSSPTTKLFFSIVDLHAITVPQQSQQLRLWKRETFTSLLATGLDPHRCVIFYQSDVSLLGSFHHLWSSRCN